MQGSDPFYFHFIFIFFILKGASAPPFYLGTPDGGQHSQIEHKRPKPTKISSNFGSLASLSWSFFLVSSK